MPYLIPVGSFWEMRFSSACSYRFHHRNLEEIKILLWESGLPVAWIYETGRQISRIMERALTYRWSTTVYNRPGFKPIKFIYGE